MKKSKRFIILTVGVLFLAPFLVPLFIPWSTINCQCQDINIKTGQARYSHYVWFVKVSERVEETPLSRALDGELVDVAELNAWQRVNTRSLWVKHSPHYVFHGALFQVRQIEKLYEQSNFTDGERKKIAKNLLEIWQRNGSCFSGNDYIQQLMTEEVY